MTARRFVLRRSVDVSGVSGTGVVAEGVLFSDGTPVLHWPGEHASTAVWTSLEDVEAIHGHGGTTVVEWGEDSTALGEVADEWEGLADYLRRRATGSSQANDLDRREANTWAIAVERLRKLIYGGES